MFALKIALVLLMSIGVSESFLGFPSFQFPNPMNEFLLHVFKPILPKDDIGSPLALGNREPHKRIAKSSEISLYGSLITMNFNGIFDSGGLCHNEHNSVRRNNGKAFLEYDLKLEQAAKNHNSVMVSQNCFDHQCPGEPELGDRVDKVDYGWNAIAENIAAGQDNCGDVMNSWINSAGHRANILGNYKNVGCDVQDCPKCTYKKYWTCVFGNRPWYENPMDQLIEFFKNVQSFKLF